MLQDFIRKLCRENLEVGQPLSRQHPDALAKLRSLVGIAHIAPQSYVTSQASEQFPILGRYEKEWATLDFVFSFLDGKRKSHGISTR
jgi:hypothetical protein